MIFSNTNAVHWNFLVAASQGRIGAFETYLSHELGLQKPEPDSYALVAARAGLAPESLLFFDDLPANLEGARQAGFQAEVFTGQQDLQQDLAGRSLVGL
jgi:putative hydrolase of the HAD superfamily